MGAFEVSEKGGRAGRLTASENRQPRGPDVQRVATMRLTRKRY